VNLTLTPAELLEVTGSAIPGYQLRYFRALGIPVHRRPDGSLSVVREHLLHLQRSAPVEYKSGPEPRLKLELARNQKNRPNERKTQT
jgi:hypothetical protein